MGLRCGREGTEGRKRERERIASVKEVDWGIGGLRNGRYKWDTR